METREKARQMNTETAEAIARFDALRKEGVGYLKAIRAVKNETGINLRKLDFTPYREAQDQN